MSDTSSEEEEIDAQSSTSEDILIVIEEVIEDSSPPAINKIKNWNQGSTSHYYLGPTALIFSMRKKKVLRPLTSVEMVSANGI